MIHTVAFIAPTDAQPRFHKRASYFLDAGWTVTLYGFSRKYFVGANVAWPVVRLGEVANGSYIRRCLKLITAAWTLRRGGVDSDVLYCFGFDCLIVGLASKLFARQKGGRVLYEVGDLRPAQLSRSFAGRVMRFFEAALIRRFRVGVVVTSPDYCKYYFRLGLKLPSWQVAVLENKLPRAWVSKFVGSSKRSQDPLLIGYFGYIRCARSILVLEEACRLASGRLKVEIWGYLSDELEGVVRRSEYLAYRGAFKSPEDLARLYGGVDVVWGCYPYDTISLGNWRFARTNRFYESAAFGKPLFVSAGSGDWRAAGRRDWAIPVDLADATKAAREIATIALTSVGQWRSRDMSDGRDLGVEERSAAHIVASVLRTADNHVRT